ncbi:hypothetical protein [Croceicoccus sp. Ery5]|uniref:hypothetical protein n=1 Tax=Croceicoccus sp. Ery5 TaxID=1703340 RepID=UPI001E62CBF5|nr:hypothetical protein [Croceicoccus sp. Ery5]
MHQIYLTRYWAVPLILLSQTACWDDSSAETTTATSAATSAGAAKKAETISDEEIFTAAGFTQSNGAWSKCGDPGTVSYEPGDIVDRGDFNGDGLPDAVVVEYGTYCFGMTGSGYTLVSRKADGAWIIVDERPGILRFLNTRGKDGWPDIEVGGPGFCFPVIGWNGTSYETVRWEYEGKACQKPY